MYVCLLISGESSSVITALITHVSGPGADSDKDNGPRLNLDNALTDTVFGHRFCLYIGVTQSSGFLKLPESIFCFVIYKTPLSQFTIVCSL